ARGACQPRYVGLLPATPAWKRVPSKDSLRRPQGAHADRAAAIRHAIGTRRRRRLRYRPYPPPTRGRARVYIERDAHAQANEAIVFVASRSSACTASSRCSSFVSSSLVCERPRSDCTNTISVGTPERTTYAASTSATLATRCDATDHTRLN